MKHRITLLSVIFFMIINNGFASILRVNNDPSLAGLGVYSTLFLAHDAAVNGDTIHLEGSPADYINT